MAYRGITARLPIGSQGFTGTRNPSQAQPGHLTYTDGAELDGGIIRKEGGAQKINASALGGVPDPQTITLLHLNGVDAATTFPDSALVPLTYTAVNTAQIDTAQSKFGGASLLLDGTGDFLTTPDVASLSPGAQDFTMDAWFNLNDAGGTSAAICGKSDAGFVAATSEYYVRRRTTNTMQCGVSDGAITVVVNGTTQYTNAINPGWHHIAFVRFGNILKMFIDGVQEGGNVAFTGTIPNTTNVFAVGARSAAGTDSLNGWIDELRISIGIARWTANFTPPISPYGNLIPPASSIISGINWDPTPGAHHDVVFLSNGSVLQDTGAGTFPTIMTTGLTAVSDPPPLFVPAGGESVGGVRKLFLFSGSNQVRVALGAAATMAAIGSPAADWTGGQFPTFGVQHGLRMFAGGNASDPHRIYYSTIADHGDFLGAGSGTLPIHPGESERIVAGLSFKGILLLWKYPLGIYVVDARDATPANWKVSRLTKAVGCINQHCIVQIENDVLYMDHVGNIHLLSSTQEFGDVNTSNIGRIASLEPFMRAYINQSLIRRSVGIWYAAKRQAWFSLPQQGATDNNIRLMVSFSEPQHGQAQDQGSNAPRFFMSRRDIAISLWMRPDNTDHIPRPTMGDNIGFVWKMDDLSRNKDGVAYPIKFDTAITDLAFLDDTLATKMKAGQFLELASEPRGNWDLTVGVFWDDILSSTVQFNMGGAGAAIGSFILGTDVLGSDIVSSDRQRITGSGRRIRLIAENGGLDQDVSLAEFHLSFTVMDERIRE